MRGIKAGLILSSLQPMLRNQTNRNTNLPVRSIHRQAHKQETQKEEPERQEEERKKKKKKKKKNTPNH
jgi:hypothetical protein